MLDAGGDDDNDEGEDEGEDVEEDSNEESDEEDERGISESETSDEQVGDAATPDTLIPTKGPRRRPVWTDPSIDNLKISLAGPDAKSSNGSRTGTKKLRKLREEAGETQITGAEYELRLRKLFEKLHPRPSWASLSIRKPASTSENGEANSREALSMLLSRDTGLVARVTKRGKEGRAKLPSGRLDVERLRNANESQGRATFSPIETLSFHPTTRAHVLLTTTKDRRLRLFQVDGHNNPLLETIHIPDLPMQSALFHPSGSSILLSGPRPFFYSHDLESGKTIKSTPWRGLNSNALGGEERDLSNVCFQKSTQKSSRSLLAIGGRRGAIHLLEWGSVGGSGGGSLVGSLHMNAPLAGLTWNPSLSHSLVSLSTVGTVHSWDVRNMKCEVQKSDAGLFAPNSIKGSPDGSTWAIGSESGIVNMYGREIIDVAQGAMQSTKTIKNITTTTTALHFNHSGEMLALASDKKKDALRVVSALRLEATLKQRLAYPATITGTLALFDSVRKLAYCRYSSWPHLFAGLLEQLRVPRHWKHQGKGALVLVASLSLKWCIGTVLCMVQHEQRLIR